MPDGPVDVVATRAERVDSVTAAVAGAYAAGSAGLALVVLDGPTSENVLVTLVLLVASFLCLLYVSLTVVARQD
jgi:hypothetical protein